MEREEMRRRVADARVARLATSGREKRPHLVPVTFALVDEVVYTAIDHKPKRTSRLRRLENLEREPRAAVLVDRYGEDWEALWWVRLDVVGEVVREAAERERALDTLVAKYAQYRRRRPEGPVLALRIENWTSWSAR